MPNRLASLPAVAVALGFAALLGLPACGGDSAASANGPAVCGDGVRQADEECDLGKGNSDTAACTKACRVATCGDGVVRAGVEECDDGSANADTAACTKACRKNVCGDG